MQSKLRVLLATTVAILIGGCGSEESGKPPGPGPGPGPGTSAVQDVTADIVQDVTWKAGTTYTLKRHIFVENAVLTIEAGTRIKGDPGSSLVITQSARIDAAGTAQKPIVFSSSQPEGTRQPGDWGGVVLLGKAPINVSGGSDKIEGFPASELRTGYGGADPTHNCGRLNYVRIEFAGFELAPDNELNGLSVGACGSDTELDYIQVHRGNDDGIEFFGGTVNAKHLVITQNDDDGLDWDFGWQGKVQFVIVQQSKVAGDNAFEADNNKNQSDASPRSTPTIYNATLIGSGAEPGMAVKTQRGMLLRRGTAGRMYNFVVAHFADFPIDIDGEASVARTEGDLADLYIKNSIFFANGNQESWQDSMDNDAMFDEGGFFRGETSNHMAMDPTLTLPLDVERPDFKPLAGSPCLNAGMAATPPDDGFFDPRATFVGAIGDTDWTAGWTAYPRN
jgi:hypothetical protein